MQIQQKQKSCLSAIIINYKAIDFVNKNCAGRLIYFDLAE